MNAPIWLRQIGQSANKNSPTILSAAAVAGVAATAILTGKAAIKAYRALGDAEASKYLVAPETVPPEPFTKKEIVQITWKCFIPPASTGLATLACIIGANQIGLRRQAAMFGAYTLADTAFREYKDEVLEQLGVTKERKIQDEVAKKQIDANPVTSNEVIILAGGDQLCFESSTGRYFKSDIETIRQAENNINRSIVTNMYASHNEFLEFLGLGPAALGEELGWNIDNPVECVFTSHIADDGRPCLAVGYKHLPRASYTDL